MRRGLFIGVVGGLTLSALSASDSLPSEQCKEGAEHCREAFVIMEKCQTAKNATAESCVAEKKATDDACKTTTSICHKDGSRRPPGR